MPLINGPVRGGLAVAIKAGTPSDKTVMVTSNITPALRKLAVSIEPLRNDPMNARLHPERNMQAIKASLTRYGQVTPIVVRRGSNVVIKGNGTLTAAQELGWTHLAVVYVEMDDATAAGYGVADNRTSELAEWNLEVLRIVEDLTREAGQTLIGYSLEELERIQTFEPDGRKTQQPREAVTHEYLPTESEPVKLVEADCLDVLRQLPDRCVDVVLTDPPYGISFRSNMPVNKSDRFDPIQNDDGPFIWWLYDAARVLRDGGALIVFCRWDVQEAFRLAIGWAGVKVKGQIVWDRVVHGMGDLDGAPGPQHDVIWYGAKGSRKFSGDRPKSVIRTVRVSPDALRHPTEKPIALLRQLIRSYTADGDVILDPFAGSGTTGVAAIMEGRKCLLVEKVSEYAELCRKRLVKAAGQS